MFLFLKKYSVFADINFAFTCGSIRFLTLPYYYSFVKILKMYELFL